MEINPEFTLGQKVYVTTDPEQNKRIVTRYIVTQNDIQYEVSMGLMTMVCQDIELSTTKDVVDFI